MQISRNQYLCDHRDVTGVILAGGLSRRMGRDKATLTIGGRNLYERAYGACETIFDQILIAGNRPDLASAIVPCFADEFPGSALGGIHCGLKAAQTPWIFVVPCDLAAPDPNLIRHLLPYRHSHDAVVPRTPAGFEPVFALYHKNCLPMMEQMLREHNFRIYDFYDRIRTRFVDSHDLPGGWQSALVNLNSPLDIEQLGQEAS